MENQWRVTAEHLRFWILLKHLSSCGVCRHLRYQSYRGRGTFEYTSIEHGRRAAGEARVLERELHGKLWRLGPEIFQWRKGMTQRQHLDIGGFHKWWYPISSSILDWEFPLQNHPFWVAPSKETPILRLLASHVGHWLSQVLSTFYGRQPQNHPQPFNGRELQLGCGGSQKATRVWCRPQKFDATFLLMSSFPVGSSSSWGYLKLAGWFTR